jgi:hypothetical protein
MTPTEANTSDIKALCIIGTVLWAVLTAFGIYAISGLHELEQRLDRFEALHPEPVCEKCGK